MCFILYNDDCIKVMQKIKNESVNVVFADPPYFLSNGGKCISSGKVVSVNKGEWDKKENYGDIQKFTKDWISECYRILKMRCSIWISGTYHNIFDIKQALDEVGFKIVNIIIWKKLDPPPLIYKNKCRFSYEFIIWADKGHSHIFNYKEMFNINNDELEDVWLLPAVSMNEKKYGYHPTQKPECLLERIIKASTIEALPIAIGTKKQQKEIALKVENILNAKAKNKQIDVSLNEHEIDCLVYNLYGLSEKEIKIVEGV